MPKNNKTLVEKITENSLERLFNDLYEIKNKDYLKEPVIRRNYLKKRITNHKFSVTQLYDFFKEYKDYLTDDIINVTLGELKHSKENIEKGSFPLFNNEALLLLKQGILIQKCVRKNYFKKEIISYCKIEEIFKTNKKPYIKSNAQKEALLKKAEDRIEMGLFHLDMFNKYRKSGFNIL